MNGLGFLCCFLLLVGCESPVFVGLHGIDVQEFALHLIHMLSPGIPHLHTFGDVCLLLVHVCAAAGRGFAEANCSVLLTSICVLVCLRQSRCCPGNG